MAVSKSRDDPAIQHDIVALGTVVKYSIRMVLVGNDQEKTQLEINSHSKNRVGKKS